MTNVLFVCGKARSGCGFIRRAYRLGDVIFVMEARQKKRFLARIRPKALGLRLISLDIPDRYDTHDPLLVDILTRKLTTRFGPPP